jgi:tetratricopeptide (TPR) repeat protein
MNKKELPRELLEEIEDQFPPEKLIATSFLGSGIDSKWGQTYFLLTNDSLWVMERKSFTVPWEFTELDPHFKPFFKVKNSEEQLFIRFLNQEEKSIQVYELEKPPVQAFLDKLDEISDSIPKKKIPKVKKKVVEKKPVTKKPTTKKPAAKKVVEKNVSPKPTEGTIEDLQEAFKNIQSSQGEDPISDMFLSKVEYLLEKVDIFTTPEQHNIFEQFGSKIENYFINLVEQSVEGKPSKMDLKVDSILSKLKNRIKRKEKIEKKSLQGEDLHTFNNYISTGDMLWKTLKDEKKAIQAYSEAERMDPLSSIPFGRYGKLYSETGNFNSSIENFEKAYNLENEKSSKLDYAEKISEIASTHLDNKELSDFYNNIVKELSSL